MEKLLLHVCCAPCGAYSAQYLQGEGFDVTYYYYNPNIYPVEEHDRRLEELKRYASDKNIPIIIGTYVTFGSFSCHVYIERFFLS